MRYGANSNETTPNNKYMAKVVQKGNKFEKASQVCSNYIMDMSISSIRETTQIRLKSMIIDKLGWT
jgi:hypothetical protein